MHAADLPGAATAAEFNKLASSVAEKLLVHEVRPVATSRGPKRAGG